MIPSCLHGSWATRSVRIPNWQQWLSKYVAELSHNFVLAPHPSAAALGLIPYLFVCLWLLVMEPNTLGHVFQILALGLVFALAWRHWCRANGQRWRFGLNEQKSGQWHGGETLRVSCVLIRQPYLLWFELASEGGRQWLIVLPCQLPQRHFRRLSRLLG
ncbi:protein YgfX [Paraferrimonas sedimenticola]|uniref:protein YgfX n=1 Tax=Paraferrimonas sedimenticola TaxID=375674 RepID=UPI003CCBD7E8